MGKRLSVAVGCLAIFALVAPAEAARLNAYDHTLMSAPAQRSSIGVAADVGSRVPHRQSGRVQGDWLILAGGDGGNEPTNQSGEVRGGIAAAETAVQNSSLPEARKAQLLNMLDTGRTTVNNCEMESNRRAAKRCFKEAVSILDDVMNIVQAEG